MQLTGLNGGTGTTFSASSSLHLLIKALIKGGIASPGKTRNPLARQIGIFGKKKNSTSVVGSLSACV